MSESTNLVERTLSVISALRGRSLSGISVTEIAKGTGIPAPTVTRILAMMVTNGYATQLDNGRYAPGVMWLQHAQSHANEMTQATNRINELNQHVHAGSRN